MEKLITLRIVKRTYQMTQLSEYLVFWHEISSGGGGAVVQVSGDARVSVTFRYRQEVLLEHPRIAPDVVGRLTFPHAMEVRRKSGGERAECRMVGIK